MNYYIIDDNIAVIKVLENIIRVRSLGKVVGYTTDPEEAEKEILRLHPPVVLVDLLMSGIDGVTLVDRVKRQMPDISFVMISKVSDKKMVQSAYEAGVEFFIHKPVNVIEVERVLTGLEEKIRMKSIMSSIKDLFPGESQQVTANLASAQQEKEAADGTVDSNRISVFLGMLGMLGEKGAQDIQCMAQCMIRSGWPFDRAVLEEAASIEGDSTRNVEQRARRAIKKGLTNTANAALDDYAGDLVDVYAGYVFDFKSLKEEMDTIRGKEGAAGGRVTLSRFMDGLVAYYHNVNE